MSTVTSHILSTVATLLVVATPVPTVFPTAPPPTPIVLASREYSLTNRYENQFVNNVFADNILLTLAYMSGKVQKGISVDWEEVEQPTQTRFILNPGSVFAFHDQVDSAYIGKVTQTTDAHFIFAEGFKSDGHLVGDGVCHLASFFNVVARDAGLRVDAPVRHDFATIPDVPREFGTSIFYYPGKEDIGRKQNLYITNTKDKPVSFVITSHKDSVKISIEVM